jgi:hypothetical protein
LSFSRSDPFFLSVAALHRVLLTGGAAATFHFLRVWWPARNHIAVTQRVTHYNSGFLHTSLSGACGSRQSYDCPSANNQPMSNISSGPDDTLRNFISARSVLALQYKTHLRKPTTKDTLLRPRAIARNIVTYDCPEKQKGSEVGPRVTKNILRDSPEP